MQQVQAVVALAKGAPVQLTTINVPDPGPSSSATRRLASSSRSART